MKKFTVDELTKFVHDHVQSKVDHNELHLVGFDMENKDIFEREFEIYQTTLFEGICNGIIMCGGEIEGIEL